MRTQTNKNPFEDKKWLKEFAESLKKDIQKSKKQKDSAQSMVSEIICTSKDIGKPYYSPTKKRSRK